jgi:flavin-binding protein dodecin
MSDSVTGPAYRLGSPYDRGRHRTGPAGGLKGETDVAVINTLELEGVSPEGWGAAAREALREAARTIRNIQRMEVLGTSATIHDGDIEEFRTEVRIYFEVEPGR